MKTTILATALMLAAIGTVPAAAQSGRAEPVTGLKSDRRCGYGQTSPGLARSRETPAQAEPAAEDPRTRSPPTPRPPCRTTTTRTRTSISRSPTTRLLRCPPRCACRKASSPSASPIGSVGHSTMETSATLRRTLRVRLRGPHRPRAALRSAEGFTDRCAPHQRPHHRVLRPAADRRAGEIPGRPRAEPHRRTAPTISRTAIPRDRSGGLARDRQGRGRVLQPTWVDNTNVSLRRSWPTTTTPSCWASARASRSASAHTWWPRRRRASAGFDPGSTHMSLGVEMRAGGHAFQINFSRGLETTMGQVARGGSEDDWFIGFNISRKFW